VHTRALAVAELYKKHQKRIQDGFDDSMMTELEQEIDIATRTISAVCRECRTHSPSDDRFSLLLTWWLSLW